MMAIMVLALYALQPRLCWCMLYVLSCIFWFIKFICIVGSVWSTGWVSSREPNSWLWGRVAIQVYGICLMENVMFAFFTCLKSLCFHVYLCVLNVSIVPCTSDINTYWLRAVKYSYWFGALTMSAAKITAVASEYWQLIALECSNLTFCRIKNSTDIMNKLAGQVWLTWGKGLKKGHLA